jgi:hypothetical protein
MSSDGCRRTELGKVELDIASDSVPVRQAISDIDTRWSEVALGKCAGARV